MSKDPKNEAHTGRAMLKEISVKDFAIIEKLSLGFSPGLNVITGETGAGKSIIIGALGVALGERAYAEMIKTGKQSASVQACFDAANHPAVLSLGIECGEEVILRRNISLTGKSRAYINDNAVSVQALSTAGDSLVDMHGQHEHQSLLKVENQLGLLDRFGGIEDKAADVAEGFFEMRKVQKKLEALTLGERERAQRVDLLRFQLNEIDSAALLPEEDEQLQNERNVLVNLSRLNELVQSAYVALYDSDGSALEGLSVTMSKLREMSEIDDSALEPLEALDSAEPLLKEASSALRQLKDKYDMDPGRLTSVDDRLHLVTNLKRKYGDTVGQVLKYRDETEEELGRMEGSGEEIEALREQLKEKQDTLTKQAQGLSKQRKQAAKTLESAIVSVLKGLALQKALFEVDFQKTEAGANGIDTVEFLFSANPGEAAKPLSKVASGGELSRIMLAVKTVLRDADDVPVLIFDEVDSGIGGKTAQNVAQKLKELSSGGRQVICITHLPQIASLSDNHILIEKHIKDKTVAVTVKQLSGRQRQEEIARMLSGKVTEVSLKHADEIMQGEP